jgi:hypothetical protein
MGGPTETNVLSGHSNARIYLLVPRTRKRITLVAPIGADGSDLKPLIVIPRQSYDSDLALVGITDEKWTFIRRTRATRSVFLAWFTNLFFLEAAPRRQAFAYEVRVISMMDHCTPPTGPEIDEACAAHEVVICALPPHSSNQIQRLDVATFGISKRRISHVSRMEKVIVQSGHIAYVVNSFMSARHR